MKSKHAFAIREGEIETQIVSGERPAFAVIVCDVNGLKQINDTLGHKAGDEYIIAASKLLCDHFKHSPVFRIGGDEFIILPEGSDYENLEKILAEINARVERHIGGNQVVISLGLASFDPDKDQSFHEVFQRADDLMYQRKMQLKDMGAVTRD
ncbi:MAG: GGDEF domain-containing protein [Clostridia bacterium]|nr:GGDEF domain-containing protein [Clostridia bacterium]